MFVTLWGRPCNFVVWVRPTSVKPFVWLRQRFKRYVWILPPSLLSKLPCTQTSTLIFVHFYRQVSHIKNRKQNWRHWEGMVRDSEWNKIISGHLFSCHFCYTTFIYSIQKLEIKKVCRKKKSLKIIFHRILYVTNIDL